MNNAMSMGGSARHLEVHITSRGTGKVVAGAYPTISAIDTNTKNAMTVNVPVAEMEGVNMGASDLHYGNNVDMPVGHTYTVTVKVNADTATFNLTRSV